MKTYRAIPATLLVSLVSFATILVVPTAALAATAPALGAAASFSVLADANMSSAVSTTVSGDLGLSTGLAGSRTGSWTVGGVEYFGAASLAATAQTDAGLANTSMAGQGSDGTWSLNPAPVPGVWTTATSATFVGPTLTLTGGPSDVWVFQIGSDFTFTGDVVLAGGAQACNVFWQVGQDATINSGGVGTAFVGTLIAGRDISLVGGATVDGRVLAGRSLTTAGATIISGPSCVVPPTGGGSTQYPPPVFPLINVVKVPNPLALPSGPGSVTYTFTVTNIGEIAISGVQVDDNKCDPATYISGDEDNDSMLDVLEEWVYTCTKIVSETETNTVTACGSATGPNYSARVCDTANATVVVGVPLTPPLIHLVKRPSVFALPAGGGAVTYFYSVTNPGTEPLHNVSITDDKCTGLPGRVVGHPGDLNSNNLLESNETWQFTCQTNLTQTTTNIGTAQGSANGFTVTDFSPATVIVAAPGLPRAGAPMEQSTMLLLAAAVTGAMLILGTKLAFALRSK